MRSHSPRPVSVPCLRLPCCCTPPALPKSNLRRLRRGKPSRGGSSPPPMSVLVMWCDTTRPTSAFLIPVVTCPRIRAYARTRSSASIGRLESLYKKFTRTCRPTFGAIRTMCGWMLFIPTRILIVVAQKSALTGRYMIVHNIGEGPKMEDVLFNWKITGHYRYFGPNLH